MARRPAMVPVDFENTIANWYAQDALWQDARKIGLLALRHALAFRQPGVWGNDEHLPESIVLLREGEGQLEAFGRGKPNPAVRWLTQLRLPVALVAPEAWRAALVARIGAVECGGVETWMTPIVARRRFETPIETRRLTKADAAGFAASAPSWALRSWMKFEALIEHGAAFGVPHGDGFAALAWVFDLAANFDSIGVYTGPRFRELGLGRAAAEALVAHIVGKRGKYPLWSLTAENTASRALATKLGFMHKSTEVLYRWPPRPGAIRTTVEMAEKSGPKPS